ncbi:MAG: hypothetical protein ABFE07_28810 [Armatimonadia bacterium]
MIWFIIALAVLVILNVVAYQLFEDERVPVMVGLNVFGSVAAFGLACWMAACFGGLNPSYSHGVREGFVTKLSDKGAIWTTHEGQLQIGTKEVTTMQETWGFSCPDDKVWEQIQGAMGRRVRLHYKEWMIMPYALGETSYEVRSVEVLEGGQP